MIWLNLVAAPHLFFTISNYQRENYASLATSWRSSTRSYLLKVGQSLVGASLKCGYAVGPRTLSLSKFLAVHNLTRFAVTGRTLEEAVNSVTLAEDVAYIRVQEGFSEALSRRLVAMATLNNDTLRAADLDVGQLKVRLLPNVT